MAELRMPSGTISALKYDKPLDDSKGRYDFTTWNIHPGQPSDGILIEPLKVTITKFKPNTPIIFSNFTGTSTDNTPTTTELSTYSKDTYIKYTGVSSNSGLWDSFVEKTNEITGGTVKIRGLYFAPYRTTNFAEVNVGGDINWLIAYDDGTSTSYGNDLTMRCEGDAGYGNISRTNDKTSFTKVIPNWTRFPENQNSYWQMGIGIYTTSTPDDGEWITLATPIVIEQMVESESVTDPTTIEGFKAMMGNVKVYDKEKNFDNTLYAYGIANVSNKMSGKSSSDTLQFPNCYYFEKGNDGGRLPNQYYYYICNGGTWPSKYQKLRYPFPTDLEAKIEEGFPIKFGFTQIDTVSKHFWADLYDVMDKTYITDAKWANHLFARSNVAKMNLNLYPQKTCDTRGNILTETLAFWEDCFVYCTGLTEAVIRKVEDTETFNAHEAFMGCTNLTSLTFESIDANGDPLLDSPFVLSDLSGTFEWCAKLTQWPGNCKIVNKKEGRHGKATAMLNYAFEGAGFTYVGNYDEEVLPEFAPQAFNNMPNITAINLTLDCGYMKPSSDGYLFFGGSTGTNLKRVRIKNLNHENWCLDGITANRTRLPQDTAATVNVGNCVGFDQASVEYLFANLYDLTTNGDQIAHMKTYQSFPTFNKWVVDTGHDAGVSKGTVYVSFYQDDGQITYTSAGTMNGLLFKFKVSQMATGDKITFTTSNGQTLEITNNQNMVTDPDGKFTGNYIYVTGTSCTIHATRASDHPATPIRIDYVQNFDDFADVGIISANIYCPAAWNSGNGRTISNQMIIDANNKGWHIFVRNENTGQDDELLPAS